MTDLKKKVQIIVKSLRESVAVALGKKATWAICRYLGW